MVVAVASFWMLSDYPETTKWLQPNERRFLKDRLLLDRDGTSHEYKKQFIWDAAKDWKVWAVSSPFSRFLHEDAMTQRGGGGSGERGASPISGLHAHKGLSLHLVLVNVHVCPDAPLLLFALFAHPGRRARLHRSHSSIGRCFFKVRHYYVIGS